MTVLRLRDQTVEIERGRPLVMGIVNANPDSFSDRIRLGTLKEQAAYALTLAEQGADIVDVGGESGVTYSGVTETDLEKERVVPLVRRLADEGVTVSVDTWKAEVARAALDAGAAMINDTSGLRDPAIAELCSGSNAALVVMHTRAEPKQAEFPDYGGHVAGDVLRFLAERTAAAIQHGVRSEQLVLDPGADFAKTPAESVAALQGLERLQVLRRPVLLAVSRKYFVGAISGREPADRLGGTLAAVGFGVDAGAAIVRVHDVAEVVEFLRVRRVLAGKDPMPDFDASEERLKWIRQADGVSSGT